jgi:hypothetical protein
MVVTVQPLKGHRYRRGENPRGPAPKAAQDSRIRRVRTSPPAQHPKQAEATVDTCAEGARAQLAEGFVLGKCMGKLTPLGIHRPTDAGDAIEGRFVRVGCAIRCCGLCNRVQSGAITLDHYNFSFDSRATSICFYLLLQDLEEVMDDVTSE